MAHSTVALHRANGTAIPHNRSEAQERAPLTPERERSVSLERAKLGALISQEKLNSQMRPDFSVDPRQLHEEKKSEAKKRVKKW